MSIRQLKTTVCFLTLMFMPVFSVTAEAQQQPKAYVYSINNISDASYYIGWPTVAEKQDGELILSYSGGREGHVCPFGRLEFMRSADNGRTWSKPQILIESILDDRDSGLCQTSKGTLLVTWFTSTYWQDHVFNQKEKVASWPQEKKQRWEKMEQQIATEKYRYPSIKKEIVDSKNAIKQWMIRSEDDGKTWSEPYLVPMMSPHGPIVASDGRLLLAGKTEEFIGLCESTDDGKTWNIVSRIEPMTDHDSKDYHELHIVEAADGTLIVQIRNHNKTYHFETLQTESRDRGKTWTPIHSIGVWGFPSHLLLLADKNILMTYSYRGAGRKPSGSNRVEARISTDNGKTWSEPVRISDNLYCGDFGYPSSVELDNNKILSIWYEKQADSKNAVLRQAVWEIR